MSQHVTLTPFSDREDIDVTFELWDDDTDTALDLSAAAAITFALWDPDCPSLTKLSAEISDGITIDDATGGVITLHFGADDVAAALCAKSYAFRLAMLSGGVQRDLILGILPIEDGGPA